MLAHIHLRNILFSAISLQSAKEKIPLIQIISNACIKQPVKKYFRNKKTFQWDAY